MSIDLKNVYHSHPRGGGTFRVAVTDDGFDVYLSNNHQTSIVTDRASLEAMRDEIANALGRADEVLAKVLPAGGPLVARPWHCDGCGQTFKDGKPSHCPGDYPLHMCRADGGAP